jgi:type IV secretory pathway VirB2 component (pilin)
MLFLGRNHPAIRILIGAAILVLGLVLHRVLLDWIGAIAIVLGVAYLLYAARRGRSVRAHRPGPGDRW